MGKALYRTHRSRSFDDVVGQKHITDTLKHALSKGALSHAYLFTGPRGVGKTSVARILAHEINNLPYTDESTHLDIIEIDAASNRRIDEIRELRDKVHIAPTSARYKVYIIDEVHMLTREAFNALLKTLEEPPQHVVFILATTEAHKVPDTIISRTQRFFFKPIDQTDAVSHLSHIAEQEGIRITKEGLALLARHGRGSFRDSISLLDQLAGLDKDTLGEEDITFLLGMPSQDLVDTIINALQNNDTNQLFDLIGNARTSGTDPAQLAKSIAQTLRDQLVDGSHALNHERSIATCKSLLSNNVATDYIHLELALLENIEFSQPPLPTPPKEATKSPKTEQSKQPAHHTPSPEIAQSEKPEKATPHKNKPTASLTALSTSWPELLSDMKGHHNTLYGILRMAQTDISDGELTLSFRFPFHKQQVESPQHKKILIEYVERYFGSITLKTEIAHKDSDTKPSQSNQPETVDPLTAVSTIFGDAEEL